MGTTNLSDHLLVIATEGGRGSCRGQQICCRQMELQHGVLSRVQGRLRHQVRLVIF